MRVAKLLGNRVYQKLTHLVGVLPKTMDFHTGKILKSLRLKQKSLNAELDRVTEEVEALKLKRDFHTSLIRADVGFKHSSKRDATSGYVSRLGLYRELERRLESQVQYNMHESNKFQLYGKELAFAEKHRKNRLKEDALRASQRQVVTVVGGGSARAQFHITEDEDFESLLDDVCAMWGGLVSSEFRLVSNYATSVDYFEKGLYAPTTKIYPTLVALADDEERGYGCAGTKPFRQLPRLYLQYSPPEDVGEAVLSNPKKQKEIFDMYDTDGGGTVDVFEFDAIIRNHLRVNGADRQFLRSLFSEAAVNDELSFDSFLQVIVQYTKYQNANKKLRIGLTPLQAFQYFDRDHSDCITYQSFLSTLQAADDTLDASECESLFQELDPGGVGALNYRGFEQGWETIKASVLDKARDRAKTPMQILKDEFSWVQPDTRKYKYVPDKEKKIIRELCAFLVIVLLFFIAMVERRNITQHYLVKLGVSDNLRNIRFGEGNGLSFFEMSSIEDVYTFLDEPLRSIVFKSGYDLRNDTTDKDGFLNMVNKLTPWTVRLRQLRVSPRLCTHAIGAKDSDKSVDFCYENYRANVNRECGCLNTKHAIGDSRNNEPVEKYGLSAEDVSKSLCSAENIDCLKNYACSKFTSCQKCTSGCSWCPSTGTCIGGCSAISGCSGARCTCEGDPPTPLPSSAYQWDPTPIRRVNTNPYSMASTKGAVGTYDGSGYLIDLFSNETDWSSVVSAMRTNRWIDAQQTRALIVSFVVYNGNFNYYLETNLIAEVNPTGSVQAHASFRGMQIDMYNSDPEKFIAFVDGLLCVLSLATMAYQGRIMYLHYESYPSVLGTLYSIPKSGYLDIGVSVVILIAQSVRMNLYTKPVRVEIATTVGPPKIFTDIGSFVDSYELQFQFDMLILLGFCVRVMKYLRVSRRMHIFMSVIFVAAKRIMPFLAVFMVLLWAFAYIGHQVFGSSVHGFRSTRRGIITLMLMNVGVYNYDDLIEANPSVAPPYFVSYFLIVTLVTGNMFTVIINEVYLVYFRDDRRFNVDNRIYHWRSLLAVFFPAVEIELRDIQREELAILGAGGRKAIELKDTNLSIVQGKQLTGESMVASGVLDRKNNLRNDGAGSLTSSSLFGLGKVETKELEREFEPVGQRKSKDTKFDFENDETKDV